MNTQAGFLCLTPYHVYFKPPIKAGVSLFSSCMTVSRFLFASVFSGKIRGAYR